MTPTKVDENLGTALKRFNQGGGRKPIYKIITFITGDTDLHTQNIIKPHELNVSSNDDKMSIYHTDQQALKYN